MNVSKKSNNFSLVVSYSEYFKVTLNYLLNKSLLTPYIKTKHVIDRLLKSCSHKKEKFQLVQFCLAKIDVHMR